MSNISLQKRCRLHSTCMCCCGFCAPRRRHLIHIPDNRLLFGKIVISSVQQLCDLNYATNFLFSVVTNLFTCRGIKIYIAFCEFAMTKYFIAPLRRSKPYIIVHRSLTRDMDFGTDSCILNNNLAYLKTPLFI